MAGTTVVVIAEVEDPEVWERGNHAGSMSRP